MTEKNIIETEIVADNKKDTLKKSFQSESKNLFRVLFIGIGCLVFLLIFCSISYFTFRYFTSKAKKEVTKTLPWSGNSEKNEEKFNSPKKINTSVVVGKIQWEVLDTKFDDKAKDTEGCKASDGNKFVYLKVKIKNLDRAFVTIIRSAITVYDKEQTKYEIAANKTFTCLGDGEYSFAEKYSPVILNLNEEETFEFLYEVPKDSKGFKLKAGDLSTVGRQFEYIDLGI